MALGKDDRRQAFPELYAQWKSVPGAVRFPQGETLHEVMARVMPAVNDYIAAGQDTAIFTHRVVVKLLLLGLSGGDVNGFWLAQSCTASISCLEVRNGSSRFVFKNQDEHLAVLGLKEADF